MNPVQTKTIDGVKTINLHGKNYVEVSERVHQAHEKGSEFSILQTEPFNISERWFVRATIMANSKQYIGTAEIKFTAPKNTPDGTNPYECAETSAIGRALGFAGFGSVEGIASYDEVARSQPIDQTASASVERRMTRDEQLHDLARPGPARMDKTEEAIKSSVHTTANPTALQRMIEQAQARAEALSIKWEDIKAEALKRQTPDADLVMKDFAPINGLLKTYEQEAKGAA